MAAAPFTIGHADKKEGEPPMKLPFSTGCLRLFSEASVYLKAHRRLTRKAMHMLRMHISMDIIAVFFMVLSPSLK